MRRLLFAVEVIRPIAFNDDVLRRAKHRPLLAVRIIAGVADRIVGNDIVSQLVGPWIEDLVRFAWREKEGVARHHFGGSGFVPNVATTGNDQVKLRLRGVRTVST